MTSWLIAMLALIGVSSVVSSVIQGQDLVGAGIFLVVWLSVAVLPLFLFAPDRKELATGGAPAADAPGRGLTVALAALASAGVLLATGAIVWRLSGGMIESPKEDDVLGFTLLGIALALGGFQCLRGREGWRTLAVILAALTGYIVIGGVSIAFG
ncbi:hypothetical protein GCM10009749_06440 [Agromyces neolithicus]|uniref:Tripartite tricarboxylate transporter TctB family protein n=1 Tax=Agromyces neolithicus TaxID=269420 RepID=A0ABN2LWN3_9MICO